MPEHRWILELGTRAVSLVEIGAHLGVPVGIARVLVSDLADARHLLVHEPAPLNAGGFGVGRTTLVRSLPAIDYFEDRWLPFAVALNPFPGTEGYDPEAVRGTLALAPDVPVLRAETSVPARGGPLAGAAPRYGEPVRYSG